MKPLSFALALLAATSVTSAFAEGGAERLQARNEQLSQQRQQQAEAVAKRDAHFQSQAQAPRQGDALNGKPCS
ncbi:hypothetical protein LOY46_13635 [Pseudomonas sichuanensis]|uniref:hypothetical protein n=1 Tax=Pseudomonas sichuanensis TaxID=2213015 RepID=UPI00215DF09B|nr:hypothetical protein [Pseudomonas sichuanensis]UVK80638.1 hypothetical protein LOY46_13635 [Pseudomonas sichuanensis]